MISKMSLYRIRYMRDHGASINSIAHKKGWPRSLIKRICEGVDVEYFRRKPKRDHRPQIDGKCTCCRIRDKAPGFRYLCEYCFQYADSGEIYPETSLVMRRI